MSETKKTLREIELFAFGFKEADVSGIAPEYEREYRIASGFKRLCEEAPLTINPADWFVGPCCDYPGTGFRYNRAAGIFCHPDVRNEQKKRYPYLADEIDALYDEFEPIRTHKLTGEYVNDLGAEENDRIHDLERTKSCWGTGGGHANPDFEMLLRVGTDGIREKIALYRKIHNDRDGLYDSFLVALSCMETLGARYKKLAEEMLPDASEEDAKILRRVITALERIPQKQPRNFFEACQFYWLAYSYVDNDSPGLFDYALDRYYLPDDPTDRYECLRHLWMLFYRVRAWNLCIGGSDEYGNDRCSELTYDTLRVAREFGYNTPNITMRFHKNSPERAWREAAATIATGIGMPAIYNDECVCPALEALGISPSDAHLYCMNGCNQIDIFGRSHMGLEDGEVSIIKALEYALYDGVEPLTGKQLALHTGDASQFATFDEMLAAFKKQVEYLADTVVMVSNRAQKVFAENAPNPWTSLLIYGCIEKGLDYKNRGPIYGHGQILTEGLPDAADSLAAIKHYVFDTRTYSMRELIDALKANFEGYDALYNDFKSYHKFGNDIEDVDAIYADITDHFYRYLQTKKTFRGGVFTAGCSTFNRAADYGIHCGALPNGKKRGESILADSIGSVPGCDTCGPTALLNSVLGANQYLAGSGNVLQMKFQKAQFNTEAGQTAFISLAKTYFHEGGQTLQVNVLSAEELKDAYEHPENHGNLIVRVGGFSTYFVRLERGLQENIIQRTEQQM